MIFIMYFKKNSINGDAMGRPAKHMENVKISYVVSA
jgi:hypothetical protein